MYPLKFRNESVKVLDKNALTIKAIVENLIFLDRDETLVENGFLAENSLADLAEVYMSDLTGDHVYQIYDNTFPSIAELLQEQDACKPLKFGKQKNAVNHILDSESFTINYLSLESEIKRDYYILDSFVILCCIEGVGRIAYDGKNEIVKAGDVFVIPAELHEITLQPSAGFGLLEMYIPTKSTD